jgi:hypothetical protein
MQPICLLKRCILTTPTEITIEAKKSACYHDGSTNASMDDHGCPNYAKAIEVGGLFQIYLKL